MNPASSAPRTGVQEAGFSLVEAAMVLVIMGIVAGGGLSLLGSLAEQRARNNCLEYLETAAEALRSHAAIHGTLPWASEEADDGSSDHGFTSGYLPFIDLRLRPVDGYGRVVKYELNPNLTTDRQTTCNALAGGLSAAPTVIDASGPPTAFPVAALLVSAGLRDADSDGNVFDLIEGDFAGDNRDGAPNYVRHPEIVGFDDLVLYLGEGELHLDAECTGIQTWSLTLDNASSQEIFLHNVTYPSRLVCSGRLAPGASKLFKIEDGDAIELRDGLDYLSSQHVGSDPLETPLVVDSDLSLTVDSVP